MTTVTRRSDTKFSDRVRVMLRECMQDSGVSQSHLAHAMGISPQALNRLLSPGSHKLTFDRTVELFKYMDYEVTVHVRPKEQQEHEATSE